MGGGAENAGVENAGVDRTDGKCRSGKYRNDNVWKAVKQKIKILNIFNFKSVDWAPIGVKHNRLAWFLESESYSLRQTPTKAAHPSQWCYVCTNDLVTTHERRFSAAIQCFLIAGAMHFLVKVAPSIL